MDADQRVGRFQGIIHGGIVSTVLDEAMSKAVASSGSPAVTCRLEIRLRRRIVPGEGLTVRGWIVERKKRRIRAEAEIVDREGRERAHAWAVFLAPAQDERFPNTSR
ncbi:MAG: PaaI family thioesterase [Bryobacteraceae bacterium]|nr:PaaI family thioesterase [Bryobacteraceae bacterium]